MSGAVLRSSLTFDVIFGGFCWGKIATMVPIYWKILVFRVNLSTLLFSPRIIEYSTEEGKTTNYFLHVLYYGAALMVKGMGLHCGCLHWLCNQLASILVI